MSNLAVDTPAETAPNAGRESYPAADGVTFYAGGLVGINSSGYLAKWANTAGLKFLGILHEGVVGATSSTPVPEGRVNANGDYLLGVPVAGASAQGDVGKPVYCASDNPSDLTLTPTGLVGPIGTIKRFISATSFDVRLRTPGEYLAGKKQGTLTIPVTLAQITGAGDVLTTWTPGKRGRILAIKAYVTVVVTTAAKAVSLNLEINTTNLTGGVVALTSANCATLGAEVAGSAITAENAFDDDDTISLEAASVTAFAEGAVVVLITYEFDE